MKTFEQKFTAWLDGTLSGQELQSFEIEHPSILHEKADFLKLKSLLRQSMRRPELKSPDFFNSRIMEQISQERSTSIRSSRWRWFGLPRLAWGGIVTLSVGFALFLTLIPHGDLSDPRTKYVAEVLKTKTKDHKVKATVENQKDLTVLKLEEPR
ncbi:MAG TPA: hypothetical protein VK775_20175 [Chthoniobacterales bacterium]|jgi:hypothetical protein|nr:hypothetical protein [Chthoniobacterales bacterium]